MPVLHCGTERCALVPGTYTLGGRGANAVPLTSLERSAEVATIVVPASGAPTIQRLTASVVVRVDRVPIGIAPKTLSDGVVIEFNGCRLTFTTNDSGDASLTSVLGDDEPHDVRRDASSQLPAEPALEMDRARLVNVRTGDAIGLGDGRVTVGRDDTCDIVVSGMDASRRHCSIAPVQGGYLLRDESANGTLVNGSRVVGTYLLGHGDVVRIADDELRFEVEGSIAPAACSSTAPTAILDVSRLRSEHANGESSPKHDTSLVASLEIVRGPFSGASFPIDRPVCAIGRAPDSDVRIRDDSVSANHATLLRKGATWFVVDLRSANGTFVDGSRIAGERELTSGSRLKLGRVELMFRALDGGREPAAPKRRGRPWLAELFASWTAGRGDLAR